jgi:hypothetical protein
MQEVFTVSGINVYSIGYFTYNSYEVQFSLKQMDAPHNAAIREIYIPGGNIKKGPALASKSYTKAGNFGTILTGEIALQDWSKLLKALGIVKDKDIETVKHTTITFDTLKACNWQGKVDELPKELTKLLER